MCIELVILTMSKSVQDAEKERSNVAAILVMVMDAPIVGILVQKNANFFEYARMFLL